MNDTLVYLIIESGNVSFDNDAVITAHATKEGAEASKAKLRADWPEVNFWIDTVRVEA